MLFRILIKFGKILSRHQIIRLIELGIMMIFGGMIEMLSVSLIIPFVNAVTEPEKFMQNKYVQLFCDFLGITDTRSFLIVLAVSLAIIYILKNLFLIFQTNIQNRFIYGNMFNTQKQLLHSFISRPYEYFLKAKSGEILRVVGEDTLETFKLLANVIGIFTEGVVAFILIIMVLVISPVLTVGVFLIIGGTMLIILKFVRPRMSKAGRTQQTGAAGMRKWLLQSIQGIKEMKVSRKERFFEEKYNEQGIAYINAIRLSVVYGIIPRYMIETVSMSAFFLVIAILIYGGQELLTLIPIVAAVAMAALRLLPAANRISAALANAAYQEHMLDKMVENLKYLDDKIDEELIETKCSKRMIGQLEKSFGLSNVTYHYPGSDSPVLDDCNIEIKKGQSVGIVGASGAGKTTMVDVLLGLLNPTAGIVHIDGYDIKSDMDSWLGQIGYIPQMIFLLDDTIRANVAFGVPVDQIDEDAVWSALEEAALADFVRELPEGLDTNVGERGVRLSGGQRQRIGIARALYEKPSILVLDEATSALDNDTEAAIMEAINHLRGTKTMIIIAHRLTTIQACDVVYKVEGGKIMMMNNQSG